ncbi:MAG: IS110 family transposase [Anaerolineae bacterium]|nr:IS110 family transposase [Anaerolineae bacterium]
MSRPPIATPSWESLPLINPHAAGLDIGSEEIWAAVPPNRAAEAVRVFGTFTPDLHALADWLVACHIETVALESTGVYWIPIFELLEERGVAVCVVNARHLKSVPGRKSDWRDCQWLQRLHSFGLLTGSFRPEAEICVLRAYLRQRATLVEHRAAHIQHMQKALAQMNLQLTHVLSDITGVTGLAILRAIVGGERDAVKLAQFRDKRCNHSTDTLAQALTGHYRAEHVFALKQALALYDVYTQQMRECDEQIEQQFAAMKPCHDDDLPPLDPSDKRDSHSKNAPRYDARTALYRLVGVDLVAISGLNASTVQTIVSEVGTDMRRFPSEKHFCSWLGLAPHNDISGGKVLRSKTLKTRQRAGQAFRLAAQSAARCRDSVYGAFYRRMKARLGPKQAMVATAHKIARTFYHLLKHRVPFQDIGADEYDKRATEREIARLQKRASKLGFTLMASAPATP